MTERGFYFHPPGQLSRFGVVDVGLKCVHSCAHCFYVHLDDSGLPFHGMRTAKWHSREHLLGLVDGLADNGFLGFDVTGGEPTLHPNIVDLVRRATERRLASRIITLGQWLHKPMHGLPRPLLSELLEAGLTDFRLSIHEVDEANFQANTGGSWPLMAGLMAQLDGRNFQYMTNTTVTSRNYQRLPAIAREIARHNVYNATILLMMAHYKWAEGDLAASLQERYTTVAPFVREAVDILESSGIATIVRYAPLCTMAGLERNYVGTVGVRYDPHEWMNQIDHSIPPEDVTPAVTKAMSRLVDLQQGEPTPGTWLVSSVAGGAPVGRGDDRGVNREFSPQCQTCSAMGVCDGIEPQYLRRHGPGEFVPYSGPERGQVLDDARLNYTPAYIVKLKGGADVKRPIGRMFRPRPLPLQPKVVCVMALFNHEKLVGRAIGSVLAQTYKNLHLVVVDDASTDGSAAVAATFPEVTLIKLEQNSGQPAVPANWAVYSIAGNLYFRLDPDDWIEPTYVEECVRALVREPWASFVYTGLETHGLVEERWTALPFDPEQEVQQNFVPYCAIWKREVWEQQGGYALNVKGCEDWNFWVGAVRLGHMGLALPRQLVHYTRSPTGLYESEVKPNGVAKKKAVVMNNWEVYPSHVVDWARRP